MDSENRAAIINYFSILEDPRIERNKKHSLIDIIVLTVCAVVSGAETWEDIEDYGESRIEWLKRFLVLENGIPSHDTIRRLFIRLDPEGLQQCFIQWVEAVREQTEGDIVAIDGKTVRRSVDKATGKLPIHLVSAWAVENGVVLGQVATEEHSNEITAIPVLLDMLKVKGCIVTIDAAGCQTAIAEKIRKEKKADYVLAVKGNQPHLEEQITEFFGDMDEEDLQQAEWVESHKTVDKGHGRIEVREYFHSDEIAALPRVKEFSGAQSIGMVRAKRIIGESESVDQRYYISSLPMDAQEFARAVRGHWSIENTLHWTLDMTFREDESRMRSGNSAENFAMLRRLALGLVKRDKTSKKSLRRRRNICRWKNQYLERILFNKDGQVYE